MDDSNENDFEGTRIEFLQNLMNYLDRNNHGDLSILKKFDRLANKFDYKIKILRRVFSMAQEGMSGTIKANKTYRVTDNDVQYLLSSHVKKEGGFIPLLPILATLAAGVISGLAGKRIIENNKQLQELKQKNGGILPLLALLPLIFGGIAATGGVAGGISQIVKSVNDKKSQNESTLRDSQFQKDQLELLKNTQTGQGILSDKLQEFGNNLENTGSKIKGFFDGISERFKPPIMKIFKKIGKDFNISEKYDGEGLFLEIRPKIGSGIFLPKNY